MSKAAHAKKKAQLGMDPSTAAHQLRTDILFRFLTAAGHNCHRCGLALTRDDFTIEHKTPWLDSNDPVGHFFDPENLAYSHKACNYSAARHPRVKSPLPLSERRPKYSAEKRRAQYERTGT